MTLVPPDAGYYKSKPTSKRGALMDGLERRYPRFAETHQLRLSYSHYDPAHFGNTVVIFDGRDVRLRLMSDRGQIWAELAATSEAEKWFALSDVHKVTFGEFPALDLTLESCMALLEAN